MTIVHHLMKMEVGDEMECARQKYICRVFHFTSLRLSKEYLTGFRIYSCTIKRGVLIF